MQKGLNLRYGYLRFRQEFERLNMFYLKRAKKSKNGAKICAKLNDVKFDDVPTIMIIEKALLDYRKYLLFKH